MKKIYLPLIFHCYSKFDIYSLAGEFGDGLCDFLEEDLFCMLLDSQKLVYHRPKDLFFMKDLSYILHPAAQALEGFLEKIIWRKKLKKNKKDKIGDVFGKKDDMVRAKIKNRKLIARVKSIWDFCRNDVMHYPDSKRITTINITKRYDEIVEIIKLTYESFYINSKLNEKDRKEWERILSHKIRKNRKEVGKN